MEQWKNYIWPVLMTAVMTAIFCFSSQVGESSHETSNRLAIWLFHMVGVEDPSAVKLLFGFTIRKWAHITAYACLGVTALGTFRNWWKAGGWCYLYACFDELHQAFVPGRGPALTDTFIDALGFGSIILLWCIRHWWKNQKQLR